MSDHGEIIIRIVDRTEKGIVTSVEMNNMNSMEALVILDIVKKNILDQSSISVKGMGGQNNDIGDIANEIGDLDID